MFFRKGQVTILALLLGLLGLTISLSVATRSISDLRQATVVDQGTKALAAAEAGVQFALNVLSSGGTINSCPAPAVSAQLSLAGIKPYNADPNLAGVSYTLCSNTVNYGIYPSVAQDDVVQVNIAGQPQNVKGFQVLWKNPNAAVEIIKISNTNGLTRYFYNGPNVVAANNFPAASPGSSCYRPATDTSPCGDSSFNNSTSSCAGYYSEIPYSKSGGDTYLRVKSLYASSDIVVCSDPAGGSSGRLSLQYSLVTAIATTSSGLTRKVQTSQISNFLPAVFDNVFYSGGSLTK